MGFRVQDVGFRIQDVGFRVQDLRFSRVQGLISGIWGFEFNCCDAVYLGLGLKLLSIPWGL